MHSTHFRKDFMPFTFSRWVCNESFEAVDKGTRFRLRYWRAGGFVNELNHQN